MRYGTIALIYVVVGFAIFGCSSDDPKPQQTEEEKQIEKLAKTWTLGTVTYGDDDITERFDDFALTFTKEKLYTATGNLGDFDYEPFKTSGTWDFKDGNLNVVRRNDGVDMAVEVSNEALILTFTITDANGRTAGLGGYRFALETD